MADWKKPRPDSVAAPKQTDAAVLIFESLGAVIVDIPIGPRESVHENVDVEAALTVTQLAEWKKIRTKLIHAALVQDGYTK